MKMHILTILFKDIYFIVRLLSHSVSSDIKWNTMNIDEHCYICSIFLLVNCVSETVWCAVIISSLFSFFFDWACQVFTFVTGSVRVFYHYKNAWCCLFCSDFLLLVLKCACNTIFIMSSCLRTLLHNISDERSCVANSMFSVWFGLRYFFKL